MARKTNTRKRRVKKILKLVLHIFVLLSTILLLQLLMLMEMQFHGQVQEHLDSKVHVNPLHLLHKWLLKQLQSINGTRYENS